MAKFSGRRSRHLARAGAVAVALVALAGVAAAQPVDLVGSWHVLIHFTDDNSHDPSLVHWDDKLWKFAVEGSRLRWTEYPLVVFDDDQGRFEARQGSPMARVVHGWEPNEAQRAQIASGLDVNPRGSKSKSLRRDGDGWQSVNRPSPSAAMVVTYVEVWSIGQASGLPVFRREDTLGSASAGSYDGVSEFATTAVEQGGDVLRGTFERDGSRHGSFRLTRSGSARTVAGKAKPEGRRFYDAFLGAEFSAAFTNPEGAVAKAARARAEDGATASEATRSALQAAVRAALEASIRAARQEPEAVEREIAALTRKLSEELLDAGATLVEVDRRLAAGEINP